MFLLSLEDEMSARIYFTEIGRMRREFISIVFAKHIGTDPENVVEAASRSADNVPADAEVWCVFDTEGTQHPSRAAQVRSAMERARDLKFHCAISNPCFEFWLLLHFVNAVHTFNRCKAVIHELKKYLPDYDKGMLQFDDFREHLQEATDRARNIEETRCQVLNLDPVDCHPSTGVYRLVERLLTAS